MKKYTKGFTPTPISHTLKVVRCGASKNIKKPRLVSGFTLAEIVVVIGIMAILLVIIISRADQNREQARNRVRVSDIQKIRLALEDYKDVCRQYPQDIYSTTASKISNGCPTGTDFHDFLPQANIPVDPLGGANYLYAGLQTLPHLTGTTGSCFDYHVGAILEGSPNQVFLQEDHDVEADSKCTGSIDDFDADNDADDSARSGNSGDDGMIYDFRSTNIHS